MRHAPCILILIFFIFRTNTSTGRLVQFDSYILKGKVKSIVEYQIWNSDTGYINKAKYDLNGYEIYLQRKYQGKISWESNAEWGPKYKSVKKNIASKNTTQLMRFRHGYPVSEIFLDSSNRTLNYAKFYYRFGKERKVVSYNADSSVHCNCVFQWKNGEVDFSRTRCEGASDLSQGDCFQYPVYRREMRRRHRWAGDWSTSNYETTSEYDRDNNVIRVDWQNPEKPDEKGYWMYLEYDEQGNWHKRISGDGHSITLLDIEYY